MEIKRSIKLVLRKRGEHTYVCIRVQFNGAKQYIGTGYSPDKEQWDSEKQKVKSGFSQKGKTYKQINRVLSGYVQTMEDVFAKYELRKTFPTIKQVTDDYNKVTKRKQYKQLEENRPLFIKDALREFINNQKVIRSWTRKMEQQFENVIKQITSWNEYATMQDLNEDNLANFVQWLTSSRGGNLKNTTAKKRITQLKDFLRWADKSKTFKNDLYETFTPKLKEIHGDKEIVYLTREELNLWREYTFKDKDKALEQIRDVFTFLCFTGMRHSDAKKLKHTDIIDGVIHVVTKKTSDSLTINLNNTAQSILDKYKDFDETFALPVVSQQPMNNYLKKIGELIGLDAPIHYSYFQGNKRFDTTRPKWQCLSTHAGRRTFVVTAITIGMDTNVIMKFTGHSSLSAMKPYMAVVDDLKKREMDKFNEI